MVSTKCIVNSVPGSRVEFATYVCRDKDTKRSSIGKETVLVDRRDNGINLDCGLEIQKLGKSIKGGHGLPFRP